MSKELTPLQALKELVYGQEHIKGTDVEERLYHIIETALKDYEYSQKQRELYFKQAKELKKLYKAELKNTAYYNNLALKYKKALEILKEWFEVFEDEYGCHLRTLFDIGRISKKEYELLKEILK